MTEKQAAKTYKTLSEIMEEPAGECLDIIARVAPALERFISKSGIIRTLIEKQGTASTKEEAAEMAELTAAAILKYALGECQGEAVEIVAAVNGLTVEELRRDYTGWELAKMIKAVVMDKGFLLHVRTLTD